MVFEIDMTNARSSYAINLKNIQPISRQEPLFPVNRSLNPNRVKLHSPPDIGTEVDERILMKKQVLIFDVYKANTLH